MWGGLKNRRDLGTAKESVLRRRKGQVCVDRAGKAEFWVPSNYVFPTSSNWH